jgi:hypothetical protein
MSTNEEVVGHKASGIPSVSPSPETHAPCSILLSFHRHMSIICNEHIDFSFSFRQYRQLNELLR